MRRDNLIYAQVDTLKPSSFDGSKPSRYGRRGHIASAINVPVIYVASHTVRGGGQSRACGLALGDLQ